jgi:uncharacterized membrane protein SpoIIM required for sporulation
MNKVLPKTEKLARGEDFSGEQITHFSREFRNLCSQLAGAVTGETSEAAQRRLHARVAAAHAQLYRHRGARKHRLPELISLLFRDTPSKLLRDPCLHLAAALFLVPFLGAGLVCFLSADVAERILGEAGIRELTSMYEVGAGTRTLAENMRMSIWYIQNNVLIAIQCFAFGIFLGFGSGVCLLMNGLVLGASFGYILSTPYAMNFMSFVTAHGPFELTGIVIAGAAGLKLGYSLVKTEGYTRLESLRRGARAVAPVISAAAFFIFFAAFIEAFWSPMNMPYFGKVWVAFMSVIVLALYFGAFKRRRRP